MSDQDNTDELCLVIESSDTENYYAWGSELHAKKFGKFLNESSGTRRWKYRILSKDEARNLGLDRWYGVE